MRRSLLSLLIPLALVHVACTKEPPAPTRWDTDAAPGTIATAAVSPEAKPGSVFNAFFPPDGTEGTKRIFTQEKAGFAEAKVQKDGRDIAVLSISDTLSDEQARKKFSAATDKIGAFPLITVGKNQSALLVKDRYQVKVSSQTLDDAARKAWLSQFNVNGIAGL